MYRQIKHIIPFYPLIQLCRSLIYYRSFPLKRFPLLMIWFIKTVIIEPFRITDALITLFLPPKKIEPIFIVGFYRSGTTYLQELLSRPAGYRTMTLFDSVVPEICLCFQWLFKPIFTVITKLLKSTNPYHSIPFDWNFPGEEDVAINALGAFVDYNKVYQFPSRYKKISGKYLLLEKEQDRLTWEADYLFLLKKLAFKAGRRKLVLKSPPNLARVHLLKKLFPNARFVFIHRDPFDAIPSSLRLWKLNQQYAFEEYTLEAVGPIIADQYVRFYDSYKKNAHGLTDASVSFAELTSIPAVVMDRLDQQLKLGLTAADKIAIEQIISMRKKPVQRYTSNAEMIANNPSLQKIREELGYA